MAGFRGLLIKELKEQLRAYRLLTYGVVLLLMGVGSEISLKFLPQILELAGDNMNIELPEVSAADAMINYGGNVAQLGALAAILLAMGSVARERENGTAALTLSKPVTEAAYVLAKLTAHVSSITVAVVGVSVLAFLYAVALFPGTIGAGVIWYVATLALFVWFAAAVTIGVSCLLRSQIAAGVTALVIVGLLGATSSLPVIGKYLPGAVLGWGNRVLLEQPAEARWIALAVMVLIGAGAVAFGWRRLRTVDV